MECRLYTTDFRHVDLTDAVIPEGYTLFGAATERGWQNHCHPRKPVLILTKDSKYYAQCACGENLTSACDCGNDALIAFRNLTR